MINRGCGKYSVDRILSYVEGTLDPAAKSGMDAHALECRECRSVLLELTRNQAVMDSEPGMTPVGPRVLELVFQAGTWLLDALKAPGVSLAELTPVRNGSQYKDAVEWKAGGLLLTLVPAAEGEFWLKVMSHDKKGPQIILRREGEMIPVYQNSRISGIVLIKGLGTGRYDLLAGGERVFFQIR